MDVQAMPSLKDLCEGTYTRKGWLNYYKNVWTRNLIAAVIDVDTDKALKAINPEEMVEAESGQMVPVKIRLEMRKMVVQERLDILAGIENLLAISDEEFDAKVLSKEALAVATDMIEKKAGDACKAEGDVDGTYQETVAAKDGQPAKLTCIPNGTTVEDFLKAQVEKAKAEGENKSA